MDSTIAELINASSFISVDVNLLVLLSHIEFTLDFFPLSYRFNIKQNVIKASSFGKQFSYINRLLCSVMYNILHNTV
jgi:hypothetical protein